MKSKFYLFVLAFIASPVLTFAVCQPSFVMSINSQDNTVCTGVSVTFTNNSNLNGGELPTVTLWNFGDGSTVETTENAVHTFNALVDTFFVVQYTISSPSCNGLVYEDTVFVIQPPTIQTGGSNMSCFQLCDGIASIQIEGPHTNYAIDWDPTGEVTPTIFDLCAGNYFATVSDIYGCSVNSPVITVNEPDELIANVGPPELFMCIGESQVISDAIVIGGTPPYTYDWTILNTEGLDDTDTLTPTLTANANSYGTPYKLHVTDFNGCIAYDVFDVMMTPARITGTVYLPSGPPDHVDGGNVYLIQKEGDNEQWTYLDTVPINFADGTYFFDTVPLNDVIILFEPTAAQNTLIPTYYGDTYDWNLAAFISPECDILYDSVDINCVGEMSEFLDGTCTFRGAVYEVCGTPCKTSETDPIPLIDVVVKKTPPGNAITYDETGDIGAFDYGEFEIQNVDVDSTYSFVVNVPGLGMFENYPIAVTASDSGFVNLNFYVVTDSDYGTPGVYIENPDGIINLKHKQNQMLVLPNPFTDNCQLIFVNEPNGAFTFSLYDVSGKLITRTNAEGNKHLVKTETLDPGVYIAEITTAEEVFRSRVVKK